MASRRVTATLSACLVVLAALTGCGGSADAGGGDEGFVAGDGSIVVVPVIGALAHRS